MRTTFRPGYGPPEMVSIREVPVPTPKPGEVLVRVRTASVNRTDVGNLRGKPFVVRFFAGFPKPRSTATGCDFAGEVVEVGDGVGDFSPGDRVYGLNDTGLGSHAQYLTVSAEKTVLQMPQGISFDEAVGCTEGAFYAVNFLNKVALLGGERVLVIGGTGAIGSAVLQLVAARGIHVDAVCPREHFDLVRSLGAQAVFDSAGQDHLGPAQPYDFVFDAVGKSRFGACRSALTPTGVYISSELGPHGENLYLVVTTRARKGPRVVFPFPRDPKGSLSIVRDLVIAGSYRAVIDRSFPLDDVQQAFRYVETGQKIGTVVLDLG